MIIRKKEFNNTSVFPQADDIYKVKRIVQLYSRSKPNELFVMDELGFTATRQIQYYLSAAQFIGLMDYDGVPTPLGKLIIDQELKVQFQLLVYLILSDEVFQHHFRTRNSESTIDLLVKLYGLSLVTARRRLSTVKQWNSWCDIVIKDYGFSIEWESENGD